MILYIQIILIIVLCSILAALYIDEKQNKKVKFPSGKLTRLWDGSERRRYVRISADIPVKYGPRKEPANHIKAIQTKDISVGGICLTIKEKLNHRLKLCLQIETPGSPDPIHATGEVVWVKENSEDKNDGGVRYFDTGIEFKEVRPEDRERLFNYIKESNKDGQN